MSESNLWNKLRTNLVNAKVWQEATRHEDKLSLGIADVSFIQAGRHGWMELKWVADWPVRDSTVVRIPHYSIEQKDFLLRKGQAGGKTWVFLQVGGDHLLFDWLKAQRVGECSRPELVELANAFWWKRLNYDELAEVMYCHDN